MFSQLYITHACCRWAPYQGIKTKALIMKVCGVVLSLLPLFVCLSNTNTCHSAELERRLAASQPRNVIADVQELIDIH